MFNVGDRVRRIGTVFEGTEAVIVSGEPNRFGNYKVEFIYEGHTLRCGWHPKNFELIELREPNWEV